MLLGDNVPDTGHSNWLSSYPTLAVLEHSGYAIVCSVRLDLHINSYFSCAGVFAVCDVFCRF